MFQALLVPVDVADVETARPALDRAVELAKLVGGAVRLVHVMSVAPTAYAEFVPVEIEADVQGDAEKRLADLAASLDLPSERVSAVVRQGAVTAEVLAEAELMAADLVVLGSRDPDWTSYLLGSHAGSLARDATCSILIVRGG